jgi:hypothetical protein
MLCEVEGCSCRIELNLFLRLRQPRHESEFSLHSFVSCRYCQRRAPKSSNAEVEDLHSTPAINTCKSHNTALHFGSAAPKIRIGSGGLFRKAGNSDRKGCLPTTAVSSVSWWTKCAKSLSRCITWHATLLKPLD